MGLRQDAVPTLAAFAAAVLIGGCGSTPHPGASTPRPDATASGLPAPKSCPGPAMTAGPTGAPEPSVPAGLIQATTPIVAGPEAVGSGFGSVWVVAHRSNTVFRIDPATDQVIASIPIAVPDQDVGVGPISGGPHGVWLPVSATVNGLFSIDPSTNSIAGRFPFDGAYGIADSNDGLWVGVAPYIPGGTSGALRYSLIEIDPKTARPIRKVDLGPAAGSRAYFPGVQFGLSALWVVIADDAIARIDPDTGRVVATIRTTGVPRGYGEFAISGHDIFAAMGDSTVDRVDASTNCVDGVVYLGHTLALPANPMAPRVGIATSINGIDVVFDRGALALIDPETLHERAVYRIDRQDYTGGVLEDFGSIWFLTFGNDTVLRLRSLG